MNERRGLWRTGISEDMKDARDSFATAVVDDVVYVIGGRLFDSGSSQTPLSSVESIQPCF